MLVRVRTRDGTEKVTVADGATVGELRRLLETSLKVPYHDQTLSLDQRLLLAPEPAAFRDMVAERATLASLGVQHGSLVFFRYSVQREVTPNAVPVEARAFGAHMTIADMVLRQCRVERQEKPRCASLSFDGQAANVFQAYVSQALAFSIQRAGWLYGTCDEEGAVCAHFIYEPPQQGSADSVEIQEDEQEQRRVDFIAERLGFKRVGWIFSASNAVARDFPLSGGELLRMAALQAAGGEHFVTAVVSLVADEEGATSVHFEAFQASEQAAKLVADAWLIAGSDDPKFVATNPGKKEAVIVAGRDVTKVEVEFLLTVVPIMDHEGPLRTRFPVENRLTGQSADDLKACLRAAKDAPYAARLTDFHLLLFLSNVLDLQTDVALLCEAVRTQGPVQDGYTLIIDSIAGISS